MSKWTWLKLAENPARLGSDWKFQSNLFCHLTHTIPTKLKLSRADAIMTVDPLNNHCLFNTTLFFEMCFRIHVSFHYIHAEGRHYCFYKFYLRCNNIYINYSPDLHIKFKHLHICLTQLVPAFVKVSRETVTDANRAHQMIWFDLIK